MKVLVLFTSFNFEFRQCLYIAFLVAVISYNKKGSVQNPSKLKIDEKIDEVTEF